MYSSIRQLLFAIPLLLATSQVATASSEPSTGAVIKILEAQGLANWTADADGFGKLAYFSHEVWNAAEAQAIFDMKALHNVTEEHPNQERRSVIQRRKDGDLPDGVSDAGGTKHAAHWYCYGSGSDFYNTVLPFIGITICAGPATALEAIGTGQ